MPAKILITGKSNTGKTTLLKTLKNAFVVSRDGKPFSLRLPHVNVPDFAIHRENGENKPDFTVDKLTSLISEKLDLYNEKFGEYPDTIVFDSVSRIGTDLERTCQEKYSNFEVWSNLNKEMNKFVQATNDLLEAGFNVILIAHAVLDPETKQFIETCKGSFAKTGGFLSTVDYALNIDIVGSKRFVFHHGMSLSRTLLEGMPDKQNANDFDLQEYVDKIKEQSSTVTEEWSI